MAAITICSDAEAQENKVCHFFHFFRHLFVQLTPRQRPKGYLGVSHGECEDRRTCGEDLGQESIGKHWSWEYLESGKKREQEMRLEILRGVSSWEWYKAEPGLFWRGTLEELVRLQAAWSTLLILIVALWGRNFSQSQEVARSEFEAISVNPEPGPLTPLRPPLQCDLKRILASERNVPWVPPPSQPWPQPPTETRSKRRHRGPLHLKLTQHYVNYTTTKMKNYK